MACTGWYDTGRTINFGSILLEQKGRGCYVIGSNKKVVYCLASSLRGLVMVLVNKVRMRRSIRREGSVRDLHWSLFLVMVVIMLKIAAGTPFS